MNIVIIDTGCANIASVKFALQRLDYQPIVTGDHEVIRNADRLILPGVGTAEHAMENIKAAGLDRVIQEATQPLLGICLGMQLLTQCSLERSQSPSKEGNKQTVACLGRLDGLIQPLETAGLPLPHMGWNQVFYPEGKAISPLFAQIPNGSYFYFVHSYAIGPNSDSIGVTHYGQSFGAAIAKQNVYGVQFHPERSSKAGAQLLQNFMMLSID